MQDELKDVTPHNNFIMFVCLKAEWYFSFLLLVFRTTPQAPESKEPPAILCAEPGSMKMSTMVRMLPSQGCSPSNEQVRGDPRWSDPAGGIDKPHDELGKGNRETISKQRLHGVSGKARLLLLRTSSAAEFGRAMHPEQELWLSTPSPSWLGESPFPLTVVDLGSLYSGFHRQQEVKGPQAGKAIKFSMQAGSTISGADWCAQCISQAWPLERFQEGGGTYFIH